MTAQPDNAPDPATQCRRLLRRSTLAALATAERDPAGWPYASLAQVATAHDGTPLLLLSDLADHTKNFARDDRVSLLFDDTRSLANPLTGARVTVQGRVERLDETDASARLQARYLARHPDAADYAGFADFNFYRVVPERLHLVAGFGKIHWLAAADVLLDPARTGTLAEEERGILDHMNADHADAVDLYAGAAVADAPSGWRMTGIDPEGLDLQRQGVYARLDFDTAITDGASARQALVRLVNSIRADKGLERNG
jgi:hypothetical protein